MSGPGTIWQQAADNFDRHYQAIGDDQWEAPTTCGEWTVRELVDHAVHWQAIAGSIVGAGTTPGDEWSSVRPAVGSALSEAANLEGVAGDGPFAGMPKHQVVGVAAGDILLHSWDLARAIGADATLPADAVQAVMMGLQRLPPEMMRAPGMFGPAVEVADDADPQTRLLAFSGRQP